MTEYRRQKGISRRHIITYAGLAAAGFAAAIERVPNVISFG